MQTPAWVTKQATVCMLQHTNSFNGASEEVKKRAKQQEIERDI